MSKKFRTVAMRMVELVRFTLVDEEKLNAVVAAATKYVPADAAKWDRDAIVTQLVSSAMVKGSLSTVDRIRIGESELMKFASALCGYNPFIKVRAMVRDSRVKEVACKVYAGYGDDGLPVKGKVYKPFGIGTNSRNKSESFWIDEEVLKNKDWLRSLMDWLTLGLPGFHISDAKLGAYLFGTRFAPTTSYADNGGDVIRLGDVVCVKDFHMTRVSHDGVFVTDGGVSVEPFAEKAHDVNLLDGQAAIDADAVPMDGSFRFVTGKGCAFRVRNFRDAFGDVVDIEGNLRKAGTFRMVVNESVWKFVKVYADNGLTWRDFVTACEQAHQDEVRLLIPEHDLDKKDLPYQQVQAMFDADPSRLIASERRTLLDYLRNPQKLLSHQGRAMHEVAPGAFSLPLFRDAMTKGYSKKYAEATYKPVVHGICHSVFVARDIVAYIQAVRGEEVTGCLKSGECCVMALPEGEIVVSRNPVTHAVCVMNNVHPKAYNGIVDPASTTCYINIHDDVDVLLALDFDGDHVNVSQDYDYLETAKEHGRKYGNLLVLWDAPSVDKKDIAANNLLLEMGSYIGSPDFTQGANLGMSMNNLNILYSVQDHTDISAFVSPETLRDLQAWMIWDVNVNVDFGKQQGQNAAESGKRTIPANVAPYVRPYRDECGIWHKSILSELGLPLSISGRGTEYRVGNVDRYVRAVKELPSEITFAPVNPDEFGAHWCDYKFAYGTIAPVCEKLTGADKPDGNGGYIRNFFENTAQQMSTAFKRNASSSGKYYVNAAGEVDLEDAELTDHLNKATIEEVRAYIDRFAAKRGLSHEQLVDCLLEMMDSPRWNISRMSEGRRAASFMYQRHFVRLYGDELAKNAIANKAIVIAAAAAKEELYRY